MFYSWFSEKYTYILAMKFSIANVIATLANGVAPFAPPTTEAMKSVPSCATIVRFCAPAGIVNSPDVGEPWTDGRRFARRRRA
jgi:hypothetical protein